MKVESIFSITKYQFNLNKPQIEILLKQNPF